MEQVEIKEKTTEDEKETKMDLKRKNESKEESIAKKAKLPKRKVVLIIGSFFKFLNFLGYNGIKYQGYKLLFKIF
jgi:hypothetical protein